MLVSNYYFRNLLLHRNELLFGQKMDVLTLFVQYYLNQTFSSKLYLPSVVTLGVFLVNHFSLTLCLLH